VHEGVHGEAEVDGGEGGLRDSGPQDTACRGFGGFFGEGTGVVV